MGKAYATGAMVLSGVIFVLAPLRMGAVDLDGSGQSDVWEQVFRADGLEAGGDTDGDGKSNGDEARAGTDPRDAQSRFLVSEVTVEGTGVVVKWVAQPGKAYRVLTTPDLAAGPWVAASEFQIAENASGEATLAAAPGSRFYRVEVRDEDSDGDGVFDWEERQLPGFDPLKAESAQPGTSDLAVLTGMLSGTIATVTVSALVPSALEKEAVEGVFRISRAGGLAAVTARFTLTGNPDAQKGNASVEDFHLRNAAGDPVADSVVIPFGVPFVDVRVVPVADALAETPEMLTLRLTADAAYTVGGTGSAAVVIKDAANSTANERIFLAYLVPTGPGTTATGLATIRLQGDNATGFVNLSFSGLSSPQTTSFLDLENNGTGVYVKGLPAGQVTDSLWTVKAAAYLTTDQAMLDALLAGKVSVVVNTTEFLEGEIRGNFQQSSGSTEPPVPGEPPEIEVLAGEALRRDVARFLTQATFGPTEAEITALTHAIEADHAGNRMAGYAAWLDAQFARDPTSLEAYTRAADGQEWALRGSDPINYTTIALGEPGSSNRRRAWWMATVGGHDQLRQRVGFALSEIFVISDKNSLVADRHYGAARYYDQLVAGADGNFRALLEAVSKSPMMGTYLSHLKNQKAVYDPVTGALLVSPDENYAREVMQLFSIGLVGLHMDGSLRFGAGGVPVPTYTNADIMELARVLTGWSFSKRNGNKADGYPEQDNPSFSQGSGPRYFQASWLYPMKNFAAYHDTGAKVVLGKPIPAGLDGEADLDAALDILFAHDNVAPFVSRLLIQRLVTSTPSAGYIHRVAQKFADDGGGVRGNLGAVVRAILLDPEARNLGVTEYVGYGKQKEPLVRYVQLLRAFGAFSQLPLADLSAFGYPAAQLDNFAAGATRMRYSNTEAGLGQSPLSSPTVFNYFLPGYSPGGAITQAGLVAPEMQITNETQIVQAVNVNRTVLNTSGGQSGTSLPGATDTTLDDVKIDRLPWEAFYTAEIARGQTPTQAVTTLVDRLDALLMAGRFKAAYASAPLPNPRASVIDAGVRATSTADRVVNVFYLMGNAPEFLHQK